MLFKCPVSLSRRSFVSRAAVARSSCGFATTSWSLGAATSSIELRTGQAEGITTTQLQALEERVNSVIAQATPLSVAEYEPGDPALVRGGEE